MEKQEEQLMVRGDKSTEQWRPGKVNLSKITTRFPYLVATGFAPPPPDDTPPNGLKHTITNPATPTQQNLTQMGTALTQRRALQTAKQLDNNAIDEAIQQAMLDSGAQDLCKHTQRDGTYRWNRYRNQHSINPITSTLQGCQTSYCRTRFETKALLSVGTPLTMGIPQYSYLGNKAPIFIRTLTSPSRRPGPHSSKGAETTEDFDGPNG
eukprot:CCRYP_003654-RA/>CCRYP_003654-RA protein AED:0.56 eAED:0.62 QI:0/0/0/1/0/0/2/0/208